MKAIIFFIIYLISNVCGAKTNSDFHLTELIKTKIKISEMVARDQAIRDEILVLQKTNKSLDNYPNIIQYWEQIDTENTVELKKILTKWGWPKKEEFGPKYCHDVWLLTQHADHDLEFQKEALTCLKGSSKGKDKSELKLFAYLFDRVQANQHLPQKYGTQGTCIKKQLWQAFPVEDEKNIDKRRESVGLCNFEIYKMIMNKICF